MQPNNTTMVTQEDRDAAEESIIPLMPLVPLGFNWRPYRDAMSQAFARHRLAHTTPPADAFQVGATVLHSQQPGWGTGVVQSLPCPEEGGVTTCEWTGTGQGSFQAGVNPALLAWAGSPPADAEMDALAELTELYTEVHQLRTKLAEAEAREGRLREALQGVMSSHDTPASRFEARNQARAALTDAPTKEE